MHSSNAASVVIPFYGDPAPTLRLVAALHGQVDAPNLQIIVADDCSPTPFPEGEGYEVIRRETNGGFGSCVNTGMTRARCDEAFILNSDLELAPDAIGTWWRASRPWAPAVSAPAIESGGKNVTVAWRDHETHHHIVEWLRPLARFGTTLWYRILMGGDMTPDRSEGRVTDWLVGAAVLVPVEQFRAVGGFDERFHMNCEEADLQRRLRIECGIPAVYLPHASVQHTGGGSSASDQRLRWIVDSRFIYARKWGHANLLAAGLLVAEVPNILWRTTRALLGRRDTPLSSTKKEIAVIVHGWRTSSDVPRYRDDHRE